MNRSHKRITRGTAITEKRAAHRKRGGRVVAASLIAGCGWTAVWGQGCLSSSSDPTPADASVFDSHVPVVDASKPIVDAAVPDASLPDAAADATIPDANVPDTAVVDSAVDAPIDAHVDAPVEAAVDAGAGTVTTKAGLQLGSFRQGHSATLLPNGHVLICGGYFGSAGSQASCDNFDPTSTTISAAPSMNVGRQSHSATLLPSGVVLFAGGTGVPDGGTFDALSSAEIYDPSANTFTAVSNALFQARAGHGAVLINAGTNAGKVVLVGGGGNTSFDSGTPNDFSLDSAEVFDPGTNPATGIFVGLAAHLSARRGGNLTAAALPEGGLLAAGGSYGPGGGPYHDLDTAETLSPSFNAFTATANAMSSQRQGAQSVVLNDGRVFVMSGYASTGYATTADIYDPATRSFTSVTLPVPRDYVALALLNSGRVLIAGGVGPSGTMGDIVVYDPVTNAFLGTTGTLTPPRSLATATTLKDGRVIIAGGQTANGPITTAVDIFTE